MKKKTAKYLSIVIIIVLSLTIQIILQQSWSSQYFTEIPESSRQAILVQHWYGMPSKNWRKIGIHPPLLTPIFFDDTPQSCGPRISTVPRRVSTSFWCERERVNSSSEVGGFPAPERQSSGTAVQKCVLLAANAPRCVKSCPCQILSLSSSFIHQFFVFFLPLFDRAELFDVFSINDYSFSSFSLVHMQTGGSNTMVGASYTSILRWFHWSKTNPSIPTSFHSRMTSSSGIILPRWHPPMGMFFHGNILLW